jgi:hypothetical protein
MKVTFTKLLRGDWGVRIEGGEYHRPGQTVTVTRRDGSTAHVRLGRRIWEGADRFTGAPVQIFLAERPERTGDGGGGGGARCIECGRRTRSTCDGCGAPLCRECNDSPIGRGLLCQGCAP